MSIEEMIAVLEAAKAGKAIEWFSPTKKKWQDSSYPSWNFGDVVFRVKPEPREEEVHS